MKSCVLLEWGIGWRLKHHSSIHPVYRQIIVLIRREYYRKNYPDSYRMPSIRKLARFLDVKRYQVEKAYSILIASNDLLYIKKGIGTFMFKASPEVENQQLKRNAVLSSLSFSAQQQITNPVEQVKCLNILTLGCSYQMYAQHTFEKLKLGYLFKENKKRKAAGQYLFPKAYRILKRRNLIDDDRQLCLVPTGNALYEILNNLLYCGEHVASVFAEDRPVNQVLAKLGLKSVFADADAEGMLTCSLERICKSHCIKAVVIRTTSDFAAPVSLTLTRWGQLLKLAKEYKFWILIIDEEYEFSRFRLPKRNTMLHCSFLIYISLLNKICYLFQEVSLVTGPMDFIAALRKNVIRYFTNWNQVLEKSMVALYSSLEMKADIQRIRNKCKSGAYMLHHIVENYFEKGVQLIVPKAGTFALIFFQPAIRIPHLKFLSISEMYHPEENIYFKEDHCLDGLRISLCMKNWKTLEHFFKMISTV